jgi:putative SbcD/Mre11-related phosphoesterase
MKWLNSVQFLDYGIFLKSLKALVVADLHLGYEEYLSGQGVTIPRTQFPKILDRIDRMVEETGSETIVFAGDVQHDFSKLSFRTRREVGELIDAFKDKKLAFLKGNHDTFLKGVLKSHGYDLVDEYKTPKFLVVHGHKAVNTDKPVIMGHEHPAIALMDELSVRRKYKCHLLGEKVLVIPAVSTLATGTVVNSAEKPLSPFIKSFDNLKPFVGGLEFPEVKVLKKIIQ